MWVSLHELARRSSVEPHVEYVGFAAREAGREYVLRVRRGPGDASDFRVLIPSAAFSGARVRFQDGPEICFIKLNKELTVSGDALPPQELTVSDVELEEYRVAHTKKPPKRRQPAKDAASEPA